MNKERSVPYMNALKETEWMKNVFVNKGPKAICVKNIYINPLGSGSFFFFFGVVSSTKVAHDIFNKIIHTYDIEISEVQFWRFASLATCFKKFEKFWLFKIITDLTQIHPTWMIWFRLDCPGQSRNWWTHVLHFYSLYLNYSPV